MNSLKAVLQRILQSNSQLKQGVQEAQILELWPEAVGPLIAKHTRAAYMKNKTAFIEVDHPVWKQELFANRSLALKKLNAAAEQHLGSAPQGQWVDELFLIQPRER